MLPQLAHADDNYAQPYEEYGKHLRTAREIAPMADNVFGDRVTLYDGLTSFGVTDITIPGNSALPVRIGRRFDVEARWWNTGHLGGFGEWSLDVPYIDAVVTAEKGWVLRGSTPYARCSDNIDVPDTVVSGTAPAAAPLNVVYDGTKLHIPGAGNQELLANTQGKSPAYAGRSTWKWVTSGNWKLKCLASVTNLAGEGFIAVSPSGVTYTFNYATVRTVLPINVGKLYSGNVFVSRIRVFLMATRVQDRFGNWVNYSYSGNHLAGITSNDGRNITLNWSGDNIVAVTSPLGTWRYAYGTDANGNSSLATVTRPDSSKWIYANVSGSLAIHRNPECGPFCPGDGVFPPPIHCQSDYGFTPYAKLGTFSYSITAPSGAKATYAFEYDRHYHYGVPDSCNDGNLLHRYPYDYSFFDGFSILSKQVTGPGLPTLTWNYDTGGVYADDSGQAPGYFEASVPYDPNTEVYIPGGGSCNNAAGGSYDVTVAGPTSIIQYDFGSDYGCDQGRLYGSRIKDLSGKVLKTTYINYLPDTSVSGQPFPTIAGSTLLGNDAHPSGNRIRPAIETVVTQDGATFTTAVSSFDAFARATEQTESSSLGYSRVVQTSYYDNASLWMLGQVAKSTIDSVVAAQTTFDAGEALPLKNYRFGKLQSTNAWNADGTLHTVTDGGNHVTTLSNWKRGLPQTVTYADGTHESAVVNDAGWITSLADENGFTTGYGYDAMGRLASITYPSGDDVSWNQTLLSFVQVNASEYGIPAGHWKQAVNTGDGYAITYYDALWRPLVTEHYDAGNKAGTLSQTVARYDAGGRTTFRSYPINDVGNYASVNVGIHTNYDALDRVIEVNQDSELGLLPTRTQYLSGFETNVTDPRGHATTTEYMAYNQPTTQWPVSITAPEGRLTVIMRDAFGKPLSVTRTGVTEGSPQITRSYVYDGFQQLCKWIEPETGATAFGYDGAGNLIWSAAGLSLSDKGKCDADTAYNSGRRVSRAYDVRNRVTAITYQDGFSNSSFGYAADGALISQTMANNGHPVTTTYTYDKRRLLAAETLALPGTPPFVIGYGYDANGHLASNRYPDGLTVPYAPNALGQATQAGTYAVGVSYYPNGAIRQFIYGDGSVHTMTQNARQMPGRSTDSKSGSAVLDDEYEYDGNSNVAAITDYLSGNVGNRDMSYDGLDRLAQTDSPMFGGDNKALYTYDVLDNLRSARVGGNGNFNYVYDAANRLARLTLPDTGVTLATFTYDSQGNLANKDGQVYQFDMGNRLRGVPGVESYLYDASGRRVQKIDANTGTVIDTGYSRAGALMYRTVPASMNVTDYVYLAGSLVAELPSNTSQILGIIDGAPTASNPTILGWACSTEMDQSINVELYVGGSASGGGTHIGSYAANESSEPAVAQACHAGGMHYRFSIALGATMRSQYAGEPIYLYGDSPVGNNNNQLDHSGEYSVPANPNPPDAPASISVPASSTTGSVTVSWTVSDNTTSYVLQQSAGGGAWTQIYSDAAAGFGVNGLGNGSYVYRVQACNASGCSAFTSSDTLTVLLPPPAPASISVPASSSTGSITVSWPASSTATSYNLQRQSDGGSWNQVYSGSGTSKEFSLGDGSYVYRVQACNASGCGNFRSSGTLKVAIVPASISVPSSSHSTSFAVGWSAVSSADSYKLQQSFNGGSWAQVYSGAAISRTVTVSASGSYQYRIQACGAGGCSSYRTSGTVTVTLPPSAPHLSGPASSTTGTFTLSWTAESGSTRYQLNQKLNNGAWSAVYNSTGLSWSSSHIANGTYHYVVYACNGSVCSAASDQVMVIVSPIPIAPAPVSAPQNVTLNTGFAVSWTAVSGATRYDLQQTRLDTGAVRSKYSGAATHATLTIGLPGFYQFAARACNANGCSGWANATHTTDAEPAGGPRAVPAVAGSSGP